MFTKNVFTQNDPVADLIKGINEADYKAKMEALKGNQSKIDKNKNGKIDAQDFKILRKEETVEEGWDDMLKSVKDKAGPQPNGGSGKKQGSAYGGSKQKDKPEQETKKEEIDPNVTTTDTLTGRVNGKSANPFLKAKVKLNVNEEELDEASFDPLKHVKNPSPAVKAAAKDVKRGSYADRAALMKAGGVKDDRGPRGVTQEEVEELDEKTVQQLKSKSDTKKKEYGNQKLFRTGRKAFGEESEEVESVNERSLSPAEKDAVEVQVKSMKKNLAGFKARYGKDAKSVMYATATKQAKKD